MDSVWARVQMPSDVWRSGSLLSREFRSLLMDDSEKNEVTGEFTALKKLLHKEGPSGSFLGEDIDRIQLLVLSKEKESVKQAFEAALPSAVRRERILQQTSSLAHLHELTTFEKRYTIRKQLDLIAKCLRKNEDVKKARDISKEFPFPVSAHDENVLPEKLFSLASGRMQLEMLKSFRLMNPSFFRNGLNVLIQTILDCPPLALTNVKPNTAEASMVSSTYEFCTAILKEQADVNDFGNDAQAILVLLIGLSASSGYLHHLLTAVQYLLDAPTGFSFLGYENLIESFVNRMESHRVIFSLGQISVNNKQSQFHVLADGTTSFTSATSNGTYLFVCSNEKGLFKVGTGYNASVPGHVYSTVSLEKLREILKIDENTSISRVQIAYALNCMVLAVDTEDRDGRNELTDVLLEPNTLQFASSINLGRRHGGYICTEGLYLYEFSFDETSWAISRLNLSISDRQLLVSREINNSKNFLKKPEKFSIVTNGHYFILYRSCKSKIERVVLTLSGTEQYSESSIDNALTALAFDAPNNLIWAVSDKFIAAHENDGHRILLHKPVQLKLQHDSLTRVQIVTTRMLSACDKVINAYLSNDMDLTVNVPEMIAFAVDIKPMTFEMLISLVKSLAQRTDSLSALQLPIIMRLLSLNTAYWLANKTQTNIAEIFQASGLKEILHQLVIGSKNSSIVEAAQQLFIVTIEVFFQTVDEQWSLLANYLKRVHDQSIVHSEEQIVLMVISRMVSRRRLQEMIESLTNDRLDHVTEVIVAAKNNAVEQLTGNVTQFTIEFGKHLVDLVTILLQGSIACCQDGITDTSIPTALLGTVIAACTELCELSANDITEEKLGILEKSIFGHAGPIAFAYIEHWLNTKADVNDICPQLASLATNLLSKLQPLYSVVKERESFVQTKHQGTHTVVIESEHEYRNDMHEITEVHLDGATSIKITFDERSRTEFNYDYLVFYTDKSCTTYYGEEKYSGRDTSYNWPGVGGNPPLVIHSDRCFVLFHSDGSNTDWGYKFTATAEITEHSKSFEQHWVTSLEGNILDCLGLIIQKEPTWIPVIPQEVSNARFLESDLFHGGYLIDTEAPPDDVLAFLYDLIELEDEDGVAARIAQRLKANTLQDQGAVPHINRAVRAVAAAILHHNMWSMDAYALSQGIQLEPSMALLRAWKNAQKMRNWFDLGDAQRPILAASTSIDESRPTLQRQPSAYSGASEDALRTLCSNVVARAKFLLQLSPASFSLATSEDPTAAAKRWNLLAKYGVALKKSDNPASILEKWHSLVDEVEAATELKKMMLYRKSSAGRHHGKHEKTMTELVLEFVQSDVDVPDIVEAVNTRNRRAAHRSLSISILHSALTSCQNPRLSHVLLERFASTLYSLETRKVNLFNQLHGCSIIHRNAIRELYASVLKIFSQILTDSSSTLHLSVLKCFALDFDPKDGDIIFDSQIVASAFQLLFSQNMGVRDAAQASVRILIDRFIRKDKQTNIQRDIVRGIKDYVSNFERPSSSWGIYLPSNTPGFTRLTDRPVPTITFWMYIPPLEEIQLCVGDKVKQGPNWKTSLDEDDYGIGTVIDVFNDTEISIKWPARPGAKEITASYTYDPSAKVYEIVPASLDVGGQIFLKSKAYADSWRNRLFGLYLSSDYKLELTLSAGADTALKITSSKALKAANWHHVTVSPRESNIVITLDGEDVAQAELSTHFALQSIYDARMLESEHPCVKQGWQYYKVTVQGASLLRIKFDAQTSTGSDADNYLVIYQDEEHSNFYGDERYSTAESNFPGVRENNLLDISSGSFVVGVHKAENTDDFWGFRLHAYVVEGSGVSSESRLYLGEAPTRIIPGIQSARCFVHDLQVVANDSSSTAVVPNACPAPVRLQDIWHILGCIHTTLTNGSNIHDLISSAFPWLLELAYSPNNPANLRYAASITITQTIALYPKAIEHTILERYITRSFSFLSDECNMWNAATEEALELSAEHKNLLASAYSGIIRAAYEIPALAPKIEKIVRQGLQQGLRSDNCGQALASVLVLGGDYDGIFIGSPVQCVVKNENQEATLDNGWVLDFKVVGTVRFARVLYDLYLNRIESIPVKDIVLTAPYGKHGNYTNELLSRCFVDVVNAAVNEVPQTPPQMDLQTRLLKILSNVNYKALHNGNIQTILPKLLHIAQRPSNEALVPVKSVKSSFESTHPYRDSLDIYETVSFPHAKLLRITFSQSTRTEKDCDYLVFYKDKVDRESWWGEDRYSGRDGDENFPGLNSKPPLIIPASEFTYYWHTDSSNNDWGWEFTVEAVFEPMAASTLTLQQLQQRVYHLSEVLLDLPSALSTAEPVSSTNHTVEAQELWISDNPLTSLPQFKYLGESEDTPNWIVVNKMGANLHELPDTSSPSTQNIPCGALLKVTKEDMDWVQVEWNDLVGWCLRMNGSVRNIRQSSNQLPTLSEGRVDAWLNEYTEKTQASRELVVSESNGLSDMESHFDISTVYAATVRTPLKLHCILLESLIKRYALLFVRLYIEAQSDDAIPCEVFLQLVQLTIATDTSDNTSNILGSQLRKYTSKKTEFLESVLNVTTKNLLENAQNLPSAHSFVRVVENMRPNSFERIYFPGASEIRIEFDASSHCDENYAHVSFFDHEGAAGEEPYCGSSTGGNWPGLNKRPPLRIKSDYVMAYFYVSSGDVDSMRAKFTAYGETYRDDSLKAESTKSLQQLKLVLWIWSQFSNTNLLRPKDLPSILDVLCQLYHVSPGAIQRDILAVWSNWLQYDRDWFFDHLSSLQIHRFMSFIKFKLWAIHDREFEKDRKSLIEQRLLQCVLDADFQLESYALQLEDECDLLTEFSWEKNPGVLCDGCRVKKLANGSEVTVSTVESCTLGRHRWNFVIECMKKYLTIGVTVDGSIDIKYGWAPEPGSVGGVFAQGDVLTLELDAQSIRYYRNGAYCGQNALIPGKVYRAAVKLVDCEDSVALHKQPPLQWLRELQAYNPVWYRRVISTVAMLLGFNGQMRNQDTVIESEGFLFVPNARSLQVVGTSSLHHTIEDLSSRKIIQLSKNVLPPHFPGQFEQTLEYRQVVRGFDWEYGNEDGGVGNLGIILSKEPWAGQPKAALRVYWLSSKLSGVYRYGYVGQYDVLLASGAHNSHQQVVIQNSSLKVSHISETTPQSLNFAGHNSLTVNALPSLHSDCTLQLSIRRENKVNNDHQSLAQITSSAGWWMRLTVDSKKRLQFHLFTTQLDQTVCPKTLDLSSWSQIDVCLFGSYIGIHVNGELCHNTQFTSRLKCSEGTCTLTLGEALDDTHKSWSGEIRNVRLWDAPMHMGIYYSKVLGRNYNSIDLGKTTPMTLDRLAARSLQSEPYNHFPSQVSKLVDSYHNFTVLNEHSDFASIRPRGVGVLSSACPYDKVYYELKLLNCSCLQLGWSFGNCCIEARDLGIGDCKLSFAVDLCRQSMWNGDTFEIAEAVWQPGDTLGCLLDWKNGDMTFSLNGRLLLGTKFQRDDNHSAKENESPKHGSEMEGMGALFGLSDAEEEEELYDTDEEITELSHVQAPPEPEPTDSQPTPNSWVDQGGIFPSGSFLTGDGAIWNLGQRPFEHLPEGYVSVMTAAGLPEDSPVVFEIFDFDEKSWQPIAFRHGVQNINPELLGEWLYSGHLYDGTHIPDTSHFGRDGVLKVVGEWVPDNHASLKLKCRPHFSSITSVFEMPHRFLPLHCAIDIVHIKENEELVKYVNYVCDQEDWNSTTLFEKSWSDMTPSSDVLVRWPQLAKVQEQDSSALSLRFGILVEFNRAVTHLLNYVSLAADQSPTSLASWIADARGMIFGVVKFELWNDQVLATATPTAERTITLSRPKAARSKSLDPNRTNPFALFAQAYRAMATWNQSAFCSNGNLYKVTFLGENAIDGGGPYRETFTEFCSELQSSQLPLLLPTSNGQHNVGHFRDAYVLHPTAHVHHSGMLTFLGKLFGVAIRTKGFLSLNISQIIWKQLVQDRITLEDLESVDALIVSSMRSIRDIEKNGITQEMFTDYITETFTTLSTDNRIVNLVPNGDTVHVTFDNRHEFIAAIEQYRLHEFDAAVDAVRRGLGMVVPLKYLRLFTWMELESMVCGSPFVDIDLLKKCTEYSSCSATDVHVTWFWSVLDSYSQDARRAFLRFVWGRSRLPRTLHEFQLGQRFKIQAFDRRPADNYMPVSHTCFFSLELPRYTSKEVLEARLTYAIYNCQAIDGDGDTMAANQLGWED